MSDEHPSVPYGFCHCGCGRRTNPAPQTIRARGVVKGEPFRHLRGHGRHTHRALMMDRLWAKIDKTDSCWLWRGGTAPGGYGTFWDGERLQRAHRLMYRLFVGPIPEGLYVCHRCDNPSCVNPEHLFVGTATDNMRDCARKGRISRHSWLSRARNAAGQFKGSTDA